MRIGRGKIKRPYKLGVAFSGGGARGFAHLGAIRALHDFGLVPDIVAGVSAGSVVAALYAAGVSEDKILELFRSSKFSSFAEVVVPRDGMFRLTRFMNAIESLLPCRNIEELPIPTVICATNIDNGTKHAFTSGRIAERVVASCSIPIVFEPVEIDGVHYVDGGVLHNLPAWALRHQCERLIGLNCSPREPMDTPATSIVDVAKRTFSIMAKNNVYTDLELCDLAVDLTEVADHQVFDLSSLELLVEAGYLATLRTLEASRF